MNDQMLSPGMKDEPMTPKMEKIIAQAEKEIAAGEVSGSFETKEELFGFLDSLK